MKLLKALIVEDSPMDEKLLLRQLAKADYEVQSIRVQTAADMTNALIERQWDIILSDYVMPGFTGLDALRVLRESGQDIPLIIISGTIGEEVAVEAMRAGINDYLMKGNLKRLPPAIERELENAGRRRAQKQAEKNLRLSEIGLANAQRIAHIGSWDNDLKNNQLRWSDEIYRIFGCTKAQFEGTYDAFLNTIHPEDRQMVQSAGEAALAQTAPYNIEHRIIRPDGEVRFVCELGEVLFDESGNPIHFIGTVQDITERKKSEQLLRESEEKFRSIVETANEGIWLIDVDGQTTYANRQLAQMLGYADEEMLGRPLFDFIFTEDLSEAEEKIAERTKGISEQGEFRLRRKNGSVITVLYNASSTKNQAGEIIGLLAMVTDITERKSLEEQLRQSQKLESVGRLAGGIAHDFNNMLTAINGYSDLVLRKLASDNPLRPHIEEIKKAGERSAALTQQLLAYSRQQVMQPKVLNLNEIIIEISTMLQRLMGEEVQIHLSLDAIVSRIKADPGQLTQVIMNLAVNARDAMPHGGNVTIETADVIVDEAYAASHHPMIAGAYVMLAVRDHGSGMNIETQQQIFEPFFTTKATGKGTGLGLAMVYGIVKQSKGYIWVDSEINQGSNFQIYFPPVAEEITIDQVNKKDQIFRKGFETILLVEDEDVVRTLTKNILEECGYHILEASSGMEALKLCEQNDCNIDLLLTDVVMPETDGLELSQRLGKIYPSMRILFTSGYSEHAIVKHGIIEADINFIQKPFTFESLVNKVGDILDLPIICVR